MYTNKFKSCLKSVKIPAVVPCFVVVIRGCVVGVFIWEKVWLENSLSR